MTQLTIRDFRSQMASSFDRVSAGEHVFIRRKNKLYTIVPVSEDDITITPELAEKIEKARQERSGGTVPVIFSERNVFSPFTSSCSILSSR